ncbi:MAG TPA: Hsp70 family protein, partial [Kofleriaceae bacterium]|nr:Hsp70 family protein [Kofleriaceae bacterium]
MARRYLVGIDLGTTNTAVAYVDTGAGTALSLFELPQLVAAGEVSARQQLPSFVYLAGEHDAAAHELALPWAGSSSSAGAGAPRAIVGELARSLGARNAGRMISSAKSWLCHPGVDRTAPILPWGDTAEGGPRMSPVAASAAVLSHVRAAWDHAHPDAPLVEQEVVLTVPASFDETAREL